MIALRLTASDQQQTLEFIKKCFVWKLQHWWFQTKEVEAIVTVIKYLKKSGLLIKGASETIENKTK